MDERFLISAKTLTLFQPTITVTGALVMRNPDPTIYKILQTTNYRGT